MNAVRALILLCVVAPLLAYADDSRHLVLVASVESEVDTLSVRDVRRLYLGATVASGDQRLQPVRNQIDPLLEEVFLQKVIFLSSQAYDKRVLARAFRTGAPQPEAHQSWSALLQAVANSRFAVTFMWEQDLARQSRLKKVVELWSGPAE